MTEEKLNIPKQGRIKPGDIFAIPIGANIVAVAIVLHISKRFKNGMLAGYFDKCFSSLEALAIDKLSPRFVFTPNYTSRRIVELGEWPVVGYSETLLSKSTIPILVSVTTLYYKDEIVGQLNSVEESKDLERLAGQGKQFIENRLRRHFQSTGCDEM